MWQIMWMLNLLPDWFFHGVVIVSLLALVASFLLRFIPFVSKYRYPLQIGGFLLLLFGVWAEGGIVNEAKWQARVVELEKKVAESEVKSAQQNVKIVEKVVTKDRIIKEKGDEIIRYVDREITKYDAQCTIPQEFIKAHNNAAEGTK